MDTAALPWADPRSWQALQQALHRRLGEDAALRAALVPTARALDAGCRRVAGVMEVLCAQTCAFCPDPCCRKASVWYDLRDMLYLHLCAGALPTAQPMSRYGQCCRHATGRGCRLPRPLRPFVCTWYLCPVQKRRLRERAAGELAVLEASLAALKRLRAALEARFLAAAEPPGAGVLAALRKTPAGPRLPGRLRGHCIGPPAPGRCRHAPPPRSGPGGCASR